MRQSELYKVERENRRIFSVYLREQSFYFGTGDRINKMYPDNKANNLNFYFMDTKKCSKCGRELPLEQFETGRNQCRDCRNARKKELRNANPEKHRQESAKRQKEQTEWLHSLKTKCIICGESEPICLDFHHKDPSEKEFTIGKHQSKSKEKLLKEIEKCVCLCSNCHRKVHAGIINLEDYLK